MKIYFLRSTPCTGDSKHKHPEIKKIEFFGCQTKLWVGRCFLEYEIANAEKCLKLKSVCACPLPILFSALLCSVLRLYSPRLFCFSSVLLLCSAPLFPSPRLFSSSTLLCSSVLLLCLLPILCFCSFLFLCFSLCLLLCSFVFFLRALLLCFSSALFLCLSSAVLPCCLLCSLFSFSGLLFSSVLFLFSALLPCSPPLLCSLALSTSCSVCLSGENPCDRDSRRESQKNVFFEL